MLIKGEIKINMSDKMKNLKIKLEEMIKKASSIFIIGHNEPDFDSLGSAIGLQVLCQILQKPGYIILDDEDIKLDPGIKKIKDEYQKKYHIIKKEEFLEKKDRHSLLIMTDVNKDYMISIKDYLQEIPNIIILDHHNEDEHTVKSTYKLIDTNISSASEIVAQLLHSYKFPNCKKICSLLLAGIVLDTKRYMKNTTSKTHDVAEKLMRRGADSDYVNSLFLTEFAQDGKIQLLIHSKGNTIVQEYAQGTLFDIRNVTFTLNRENPDMIYHKVEIATAADKMLKFKIADASFVLGHTEPSIVTISARSRGDIDVGEIMKHFKNSGGNKENAGGKIEATDILAVEKELMQQIEWGLPKEKEREKIKVKKIEKRKD